MIFNSAKYPGKNKWIVYSKKDISRLAYRMHRLFNIKEVDSVKDARIFPLDMSWYEPFCKTVKLRTLLGKDIIKKIKDDNGLLVFYFPHEGFHPGNENYKWDSFKIFILPQLHNLGIPMQNVYFITGDMKESRKEIANATDLVNIIGIDVFGEIVEGATAPRIPNNFFDNTTRFRLDKPKDYLYLNGCPRPGKCILKYHLEQEELLSDDRAIYSWLHRHIKPEWIHIESYLTKYSTMYRTNALPAYNSALKIHEVDANLNNIEKLQDEFPKNFLQETIINLVPETALFEDMFFITEKTYKTILFKHPMLLWGPSGVIEHLRGYGYITFSLIFDETYDHIDLKPRSDKNWSVQNSLDRKLNIISENLKTFKERAEGKEKLINEILDHNQNLLLNHNPSIKYNRYKLAKLVEHAESI